MKKEKKKLSKNTKIILYAVLGAVIVLLLFNLGKPVVRDDDSFLGGVLRSLGLMSKERVGGVGDLVTPCTKNEACPGYASCTEKCGDTRYCVPGVKKCKLDGSCIETDPLKKQTCPCTGGSGDTNCDECTEKCEDTKWGRGTNYRCVSTGKIRCADNNCVEDIKDCECLKRCPDGKCVKLDEPCKTSDGCDSPCYELSGSGDTKECKIKDGYWADCGTTCCPTMYSVTEAMQCCKGEDSLLPGACCRASEGCGVMGGANICRDTPATCPVPPNKICEASDKGRSETTACCPPGTFCEGSWIASCAVSGGCGAKPPCHIWDWGSNAYLCCKNDETCVSKEISGIEFHLCLKTACKDDEFVCPGKPPLSEMNVCCKNNLETCFSPLFGRPRCLPI